MATSPKSKPAKAVPAKRVAKPAAKVASKAAGKVAVKAAPKKVARPAVKAAAKPARKPAAKPAVKATVKSVAKPAAKPVSRKAAKPGKPPVIQWKPQKFVVTHLKGAEFKPGLRSYAHYRDLAVEKATGGAVQAHVIRLIGPCDPKVVSLPHYHGVQFQMVYMLKGWMVGEYEGQGKIRMEEGSCWIQPNGIRHTVLDYSHNCEMVEIILPANFDTVTF
ncbi:MAG: hypothetical protein RL075_730 [Pseudomonadota bacterium]|jgi:hypothetical protein